MASIGEQIVAARKAKGMTQDALARALNLSRSTVSNWEIGRRLPDAQTLLQLSALLDYSFEDGAEKPAELTAAASLSGESGATSEYSASAPAKPSKARWLVLGAVAIALLCAALLLIPALRGGSKAVPATSEKVEASRITKEYFQQPNPDEAGKAFFNMDCVLQTNKTNGIDVWMYTLSLHEKHGVAFSIEELETCTFVGDTVDAKDFSADFLQSSGKETDIEANGDWFIIGGMPVDEKISGIGFVIRGTDANGSALSFVFYQPLASK